MSRYSSLDYLLKKAALVLHETITEQPHDILLTESKYLSENFVRIGIPKSKFNSTSYNRSKDLLMGTGEFSIKAEINSSFVSLTTETLKSYMSSPTSTSKPYLEIENGNENDAQFPNDTYPIADHLIENWWNIFDERYLKHGWTWTITLIMAYMAILLAGVIGNVMVILVILLRPQMRTVTNMFITNLAVADLFVIVFCVPSTLLANIFSPWILGSFMCKAVAYVQGVSGCASAYSLAAISLDRCQAIYRNYERPRGFSQKVCVRTVLLIWIAAMTLTIPWAVIFEVKVSEYDGLRYCVETWKTERTGNIYFLVVNLACFYAIPLLLIFISNWIIYCHVTHRNVPQDTVSSAPLRKMHRDTRHHVLKMLGIVTLTFLFCWLPIYILVIIVKFSDNISESAYSALEILMPIAQWLGSCNSGLNPILYAFLNKRFRQMCKSILPAWFPCQSTGKYVASRNATIAYSSKYVPKIGRSFRDINQKKLVSRYTENPGAVATTTVHILSSNKSSTEILGKGCQINLDPSTGEQSTFEIITDL